MKLFWHNPFENGEQVKSTTQSALQQAKGSLCASKIGQLCLHISSVLIALRFYFNIFYPDATNPMHNDTNNNDV